MKREAQFESTYFQVPLSFTGRLARLCGRV